MKKSLLAIAAAIALYSTSAMAQYQLSHNAAPGNPKSDASLRFSELVAEKTAGRVKIDVGGSAQFGEDAEALTNMRLGTLAFSANSQGTTSAVVPEIAVLGLPFLFENLPQAWEVMDGPVGEKLAAAAEAQGLVILAFWDNGIRQTSNSTRPITKPADLAGLKIRTPPDPITIDIFNALGANPTPLAFSELYIALQQGVVDGQENPLINIYSSKLYEVQKYISLTNHKYEATLLVASKIIFDTFTPEDQAAIREAALEAGKFNRERSQSDEAKLRATLEEAGVVFNEVESQAFVDATKSVYDKWRETYPELVDEMVAAAAAAKK
ncbi:TRAP transporter substrate-binding protein [Aureimonas glaciei]|jgi:tripartite ATP-independent transporter DctP family solute receptor|uniref:C4-dicarboxylate ABC transporter n=1 Tax=Aureimonas glaciei TaxID=1776957 RepID=A0A917DAR3_9HYPH|nr:TRAP transporter substrate-binding protein [Aureimonas glaciei]GGD19518.1 C4-dicarboxylate ABC transporter [Aureimonas glaciei]